MSDYYCCAEFKLVIEDVAHTRALQQRAKMIKYCSVLFVLTDLNAVHYAFVVGQ